MNFKFIRHASIGSTNTEAIKQAKNGAREGLCIIALQQTAGRGRLGRKWVSEKDSGLYFSIVLRPKLETKFLSLLTLMTAVVINDVLFKLYNLKTDIKWSNDIYINKKKIGGILAETIETKKGLAVIVGVGINLSSKKFTDELREMVTSIEEEINQMIDAEDLLSSLTQFFAYFYSILQNENGAKRIREEWAKRSSYFKEKSVRVKLKTETFIGTTCGLEENGALRVKMGSGKIRTIQAGDVERIR